ncbi:MAG: glutamine--tRNA ligase/YqeY domain fusion protein, partial [Clostridiales bacterium]|nr:glutamine--tRNA ligase/YqeY domain fusion protein [Clostridiales bacterium]
MENTDRDNVNAVNDSALNETGSFIHAFIQKDLEGHLSDVHTRFPPEPNGFLHIGHAKAILLNYGFAKMYGGKFNLRFDDTNPAKEESRYVKSIIEDVKWLGADWEDRLFFASDYFDTFYECAVKLINKGLAYVCDLTAEEVKEYRGALNAPGKESPYRDRSIEENLDLFTRMRNGEFPDGSKTLRAKIDMASPNINMRDPVIYRIATLYHHNTGDKWCIYPMYDYAHPIEDAIEGITHSLCSHEFEDHRPLYDWVVTNLDYDPKPRQIEFAKMYLSNTVMGKRYLKQLVDNGEVDGWDDPRMTTISGMRRRGYMPEAIRDFCEKVGVSKAMSRVDISLLEHCVIDDLKLKSPVLMAVIDPVKLIITNYSENQVEYMEIEYNPEVPEMGSRKVPFSRELYIERDDFLEEAPKKFFRLTPGQEVRLKGAYFVTCTGCEKDADGNVTTVYATYDPETKSGSGFEGRKVKGTIHWVSCKNAVNVTVRLLDYLVFDDDTAEHGIRKNPNSLMVMDKCFVEPAINDFDLDNTRFQFIRNGYFYKDSKLSNDG